MGLAATIPELSAKERPTAILVVEAARRAASLPATSLWLDGATQGLGADGGLGVESPERLGLTAPGPCPPEVLLGCFSQGIEPGPGAAFLLIVTVLPLEAGRFRVVPVLLDLTDAARIRREVSDPSAREDRLAAVALTGSPAEIDGELPADFERFFSGLRGRAEPWLRAHGVRPLGRLQITAEAQGAALTLDGVALGVMPAATVLLRDVRVGRRVIGVEPGGVRTVEIAPGVTSTVGFARPVAPDSTPRLVLRYGGPALAVLGAAVFAFGLARASTVQAHCLSRDGADDCPSLGTPQLGLDSGAGPSTDPRTLNPGSVDLYGLGLGLVVAGAGAGTLGWLGAAEDDPPWWAYAAPLLGLGLVYAGFALGGQP